MKILRHTPPGGAGIFVCHSWALVSQYCGFEFYHYNENEVSSVEIFDKVKPDIYLGDVGNIKDDIIEAVKLNRAANPNFKVGVGVHQYRKDGKYIKELLGEKLFTTEDHINWCKSLNADFVYHQGFEPTLSLYWSGWKEDGFQLLSIPLAGDILKYWPCDWQWSHKLAWSYIGNFWDRKGIPGQCAYLFPLYYKFPMGVIIGDGYPEGITTGASFIAEHHVRDIMSKSRVIPHIHENNARRMGGDSYEREFKGILCGAYNISDGNPDSRTQFGMYSTSNPDEFFELCKEIIESDTENIVNDVTRQLIPSLCAVLRSHTYFDRLANLLKKFNFTNEYKIVKEKKQIALNDWCTKSKLGTQVKTFFESQLI